MGSRGTVDPETGLWTPEEVARQDVAQVVVQVVVQGVRDELRGTVDPETGLWTPDQVQL